MEPVKVKLLGREHTVVLPGFAEREELATARHEVATAKLAPFAKFRRLAAAVGLCTRIGRESGQTLSAHGWDLLSYGGAVYGWLREHGAEPKDLVAPGFACMEACAGNLFPRKSEVDAAVGNSEGVAEN